MRLVADVCERRGRPRPLNSEVELLGSPAKERHMLDLILVAGVIGFFALSVAYVYGCDRL